MARNVTHSVDVMVVVVNSEMLRSNVQLFKTLSFGNRKPGANGGTAVSTKHFGTPNDLQEAESSNFKENRGVLGNGVPIAKDDAAFLINICTTFGVCFEKVLPRNCLLRRDTCCK